MGLQKVLVSPKSKSSSVTLVNRASSSSLVFDIRLLKNCCTLFTARFSISRNSPRIYIFFYKKQHTAVIKAVLTLFSI